MIRILLALLFLAPFLRAAELTSVTGGFISIEPDNVPHKTTWVNASGVPVKVAAISLYPYWASYNDDFNGFVVESAARISDGALLINFAWISGMTVPDSVDRDFGPNWFVINPGDGLKFTLKAYEKSGSETYITSSAIMWILK